MRKLIICGLALVLVVPLFARSQWGAGGCDVAAQAPVGAALRWATTPSLPGEAQLYRGAQHIGSWDFSAARYLALEGGQWIARAPPIAPPADPAAGTIKPYMLRGVTRKEISPEERHSINGITVPKKSGIQAIEGRGELIDDAHKLWLVVRGADPAKRKAVLDDIAADPEAAVWSKSHWRVWAGAAASPDHYLMRDRDGKTRFPTIGQTVDPAIYLLRPDGGELYHTEKWSVASVPELLKRDPNYRPDHSPGPDGPKPSHPAGDDDEALLWIGAIVILVLLFARPSHA